jgi:hypothetical protein
MKIEQTKHGFKWGAAEIACLCDDDQKGWVAIGVETPKGKIQLYITKTGIVRVNSADGTEWKPEKSKK